MYLEDQAKGSELHRWLESLTFDQYHSVPRVGTHFGVKNLDARIPPKFACPVSLVSRLTWAHFAQRLKCIVSVPQCGVLGTGKRQLAGGTAGGPSTFSHLRGRPPHCNTLPERPASWRLLVTACSALVMAQLKEYREAPVSLNPT